MTFHLVATGIIALLLTFIVFGFRLIYNYRIKEHAIEFVLFHSIPIYRLSFQKIKSVRKVTWREIALRLPSVCFLTNRVFVRTLVLIEKRSGFPRRVAITPADPDQFVNEIGNPEE